MKANFQRFVQEGQLIHFSFEADPIKNVFDEILHLLVTHQTRLDSLDSKLPEFVPISKVEELEAENKALREKIQEIEAATNAKISDFEKDFTEKMDDLREYTDTTNSRVLIDVKTYIGTEVKGLIESDREERRVGQGIAALHKEHAEIEQRLDIMIKDAKARIKDEKELADKIKHIKENQLLGIENRARTTKNH